MKLRRILRRAAVLLCLIFLTSLIPGPTAAAAEAPRIVVSLGDSYASGEGLPPYYGGELPMEERCQNEDWLAHRSTRAWGGRLALPETEGALADHRNTLWFFAAASGAVTDHLRETGPDGEGTQRMSYSRDGVRGSYDLPGQLDVLTDNPDLDPAKVAYVTLTIGGNDAGFADIIATACLAGTAGGDTRLADTLDSAWSRFPEIRRDIKAAYQRIAAAAPNAVILAAGYPTLVQASKNGFPIDAREAELINTAVTHFNRELALLAEECAAEGIPVCFVPVEEAFAGHEAYSADPYINGIVPGAGAQDLNASALISAASFHPNEKGARAYAACVQQAIDRLEADRPASVSPAEDPTPTPSVPQPEAPTPAATEALTPAATEAPTPAVSEAPTTTAPEPTAPSTAAPTTPAPTAAAPTETGSAAATGRSAAGTLLPVLLALAAVLLAAVGLLLLRKRRR